MKLYVVRHGETCWNKEKKIQGQADIELNQNGELQAGKAALYFKNIPFAKVYASPLRRAEKTAQIILAGRKEPIVTEEHLKEISYGVNEGQSLELIHRSPKLRLYNYFHKPEEYLPPPGGETIGQLKERCSCFLKKIETEGFEKEANILIVSHGAFIRAMISMAEELKDSGFWEGKKQENCSVTVFEYGNGKIRLLEEALDTQKSPVCNSENLQA